MQANNGRKFVSFVDSSRFVFGFLFAVVVGENGRIRHQIHRFFLIVNVFGALDADMADVLTLTLEESLRVLEKGSSEEPELQVVPFCAEEDEREFGLEPAAVAPL